MGQIETKTITERRVEWTPRGYGGNSRKVAVIRDGGIAKLSQIDGYLVEADPDGCIEFFQVIKEAMAETRIAD